MHSPTTSLTAILTTGIIAAFMTACSKDDPSGPGPIPLGDEARPNVILQAAAGNDDFDTPVIIDALPFSETISTAEATTAEDDPTPTCAAAGTGPTVWYAFSPSRRMTVQANTFGSDYDTDLVVYTGTRGGLTELACNDDAQSLQSLVTIDLVRGRTYYFMVGAFASGPGGTLVFNLDVGREQRAAPQFRFRGKGAQAFYSSSESDCVATSVQVEASLQSFKEGSTAPSRNPAALVFIDRYDYCTETYLSSVAAFTSEGVSLQVDNRLTAASLQLTVPGVDFVTGADVVVAVDLDWTGTGALVTTSEKTREVIPGGVVITHFKGTRREASAAGTVSLDGVNLTPAPTESAFISDAKFSVLTVDHSTQ